MSATNATINYSLPIFLGADKPAWLVDWNGAMTAIDAQMKVNATDIAGNTTSISALSTTVSAHTTSIGTLTSDVTTLSTGLNTAQGNINTINSLIGNGTPTTTDQTIIGAINELHANQGNLASLTTAANASLVAAINEVNADYTSLGDTSSPTFESIGSVSGKKEIFAVLEVAAGAAIECVSIPASIAANYANSTEFIQIYRSDEIQAAFYIDNNVLYGKTGRATDILKIYTK